MKNVFKAISGLSFNAIMGIMLAFVLGLAPALGASGAVCASLLLGGFMPNGAAMNGVLTEVWTGELVRKLSSGDVATWLDGLPDYSQYAENDVIHLVDVGADPAVLINNTTYPIPITALDDDDIPVGLDKFDTEATPITDDELYALSYNKMASVKERHGLAITISKFRKAIHALAPQSATAKTPVLKTTGAYVDGTADTNGRRKLTRSDIIRLKAEFDKMEVPLEGRRLVLCSDHVNDLLDVDQKFAEQYHNYTTGKIQNMYGFEIYEYISCPYFTTAGVKKALGAVIAAGEYQASIAFYAKNAFKASGTTTMYYSEAKSDTIYHRSLINFRHRYIVLPKKQEAIAAIMSDYTAAA